MVAVISLARSGTSEPQAPKKKHCGIELQVP